MVYVKAYDAQALLRIHDISERVKFLDLFPTFVKYIVTFIFWLS